MKIKNIYLFFGIIAIAFGLVFGVQALMQYSSLSGLQEKASREFAEGNYAASLYHYTTLQESAGEDTYVKPRIEESKHLLVAQEIMKKAEEAAAEGDWLKVKALLDESEATTNISFSLYEKAIDLYLEATTKVQTLEKKIESELQILRDEAASEKTRRAELEKETAEIEKELQSAISEKQQTETELAEQQAQTQEAREVAIQERREKFLNEIDLYLSMLARGALHLNDARSELADSKDTSALFFINQGRALFDEVKIAGADFEVRVDEEYKGYVGVLLQGGDMLIDASRRLGSAVFYIDAQQAGEFLNFMQKADKAQQNGELFLNDVRTELGALR